MKKVLKYFLIISTIIPVISFSSQTFSRELVVWSRYEPSQSLVDAFNAKMEADGNELRAVNTVLAGDMITKFTAALAAGERVDVVALDLIHVPYYASIGALEDMTDFLKGKDYYNNLNAAMLHLGTINGEHYAAPNNLDISGIAYNKDMLPNPPTTWAEMTSLCEDFASEGKLLMGWPSKSFGGMIFTWAPWAYAEGGVHTGLVNADGSVANVNHPSMVKAFNHFTNMQEIGCVPKNVAAWDWPDAQDAFLRGDMAIWGGGNFVVAMQKDYPDINMGFFSHFSEDGSRKSGFIGGDLVSIPVTTGDKDGAVEFINYMLSEEGQSVYINKNGGVPIRSDLFDDPGLTDDHRVFLNGGQTGHVPYSVVYNELMDPWGAVVQEIFAGADVESSLNSANEKLQAIIDEGPE
jgi:multiple sugar transport system substrate-binding protein|tara:strand:+ start:1047 stop:2267 length:1221 start_codon:yes stop_codon:yes gene_type:complete